MLYFSFLTLKQQKKDVAPEQFSVGATRSEGLAVPAEGMATQMCLYG